MPNSTPVKTIYIYYIYIMDLLCMYCVHVIYVYIHIYIYTCIYILSIWQQGIIRRNPYPNQISQAHARSCGWAAVVFLLDLNAVDPPCSLVPLKGRPVSPKQWGMVKCYVAHACNRKTHMHATAGIDKYYIPITRFFLRGDPSLINAICWARFIVFWLRIDLHSLNSHPYPPAIGGKPAKCNG